MIPNHFIADNLTNMDGYTWTLPSRLGSLLQEAQTRFGPRDLSYTILGIEFGPNNPRIWYPNSRKDIIVQLSQAALNDNILALYQLAHECIHLLSPSGQAIATTLEEGLATVFSEDYVEREFQRTDITDLQSYRDAAQLVRQLIMVKPDAIMQLRSIQPSFSAMTQEHFTTVCPQADAPLVHSLLMPFAR